MSKHLYYTDEEFEKQLEYIIERLKIISSQQALNYKTADYLPALTLKSTLLYTNKQQLRLIDWIFKEEPDLHGYSSPEEILSEKIHTVNLLVERKFTKRAVRKFFDMFVENQSRFSDDESIYDSITSFGKGRKSIFFDESDSAITKFIDDLLYSTLQKIVFKDKEILKKIVFKFFNNNRGQYNGYDNAYMFNNYITYLEDTTNIHLSYLKIPDKLDSEGGIYGSKKI